MPVFLPALASAAKQKIPGPETLVRHSQLWSQRTAEDDQVITRAINYISFSIRL